MRDYLKLFAGGVAAAALFAAAMVAPAFAADMPVSPVWTKAPPVILLPGNCTPVSCTGATAGFNIEGAGTNFDILGQGLNGSINSAGFGFGGQAGYQYWDGKYFLSGKVYLDYDTIPSAVPGGANTGYVHTMEVACVGANLLGSPAVPPGPPPSFPQSLLTQLTSPCIALGLDQRWGHQQGTVAGAKLQYVLASDATLDLAYLHVNYNNSGNVAPGVNAPTDQRVMLEFNKVFKGF